MASRDEREMLPLIDAGRASSFDDRHDRPIPSPASLRKRLEIRQPKPKKKDGRFGLDLDDQNRVVSVQPGGGADGLGIQVDDEVVECDGVPVAHNGLGAAVQGKERALLGLRTAGDDSEAGAAAAGGDGGSWAVDPARVRLPLLSKATCAAVSVVVGSRVFVLDGPWAEAVVEEQEDGFYLLHYGGGQRRWASSGEIAWHDIAPMPYDVAAGKQARTPRTHTGWAHTAHRAPRTTHGVPRTTYRCRCSRGGRSAAAWSWRRWCARGAATGWT